MAMEHKTATVSQRIGAAVVLFAFLLPLLACLGTLSSDPEASLPACCRSHGKHHCMMSAAEMATLMHGDHFTEIRSKCPLFPHRTTQLGTHILSPHSAASPSVRSASVGASQLQIETWKRVLLDGAHYKRGPPNVSPS
jgi:hypothetical protein